GRAARVVMAPRVTAAPESLAHVSQLVTHKVTAQLTRHADGPVDQAIAVAYTPEQEDVRDGCQFTISGRKLDQGVLAKVVVDDTRIAAIHKVMLSESIPAKEKDAEPSKLTPQLEIPEVVKSTAQGEWLIPNGGALVISLGAHTVDDGQGKALVRERLMLVEAQSAIRQASFTTDKGTGRAFSYTLPPRPAAGEGAMAVPSLPSRSLPQARTGDGTLVPLPPLPDEAVPPSTLPNSSDPCATPQAPNRLQTPAPTPTPTPAPEAPVRGPQARTFDPASIRASLPAGFPLPIELKETLITDAAARLLWSSIKPIVFRFPLTTGLTVEIAASIAPTKKP
ncbi:hypothetical protein ACYOEI_16410, partial [Singulisphaera rosea]